jgi:5-formyltetrahydrofolate cyclo-ligase
VPVATTVHPLQVVEAIPTDAHDLPLAHIVTPNETIDVPDPPPAPDGIDWAALPDAALDEMPVLVDLRRRQRGAS